MKKRIISLSLCLCIILSMVPAVSAYTNLSSWAQNAVEAMDSLGFLPEELPQLIEQIPEFPHIRVRGLMAIPPVCQKEGDNDKFF